MPFPADVVRVSVRGDIMEGLNAVEEWNWNFHLKLHASPGSVINWEDLTQDVATKVRDKLATHWPEMRGRFPSIMFHREVRAYHLAAGTGLTLDIGSAPFASGSGMNGSGGAVSLPPQCAVVVTLDTTDVNEVVANPRSRRGRFYLPAPSQTAIDGPGVLSAAAQTSIQAFIDAFLEDVQGMVAPLEGPGPDDHWDVVVASRTTGEAHQVKAWRLGRVVDTQRRRRGDMAENYVRGELSNH